MRLRHLPGVMRMFAPAIGRLPTPHLWYLLRRMRNEKPHRFNGKLHINSFFPPCPSPAFDRFLGAVIGRQRVPFSTYVAVTHDCPFSCGHCSHARRAGRDMTTQQLLDLIDQAKRLGCATLGLTGGEPLLRADLEQLVSAAAPEMSTIVFTSGHGLDASRAGRLAKAGVGCVTVGFESSEALEHDRVRGKAGSYEQAVKAVEEALAAGIYTAISTIGTREKLASGQLERLYELAEAMGVGEFRLLAPVATGAAVGCQSFMLTPAERRALYDFHVEHNRRRGGPAVASFAYLESADMFGCGAGYHHLFVDASGNVCPCDLTPLSFGNVTEKPLDEIWRDMGDCFSRPGTECLMGRLAGRLTGVESLPLDPAASRELCGRRSQADALPAAYRRLL